MNFELEHADLNGVAQKPYDALIVVVNKGFKAGRDALSMLIARAVKSGDLPSINAQCLDIYRPLGMKTTRLILAYAQDGQAAEVYKTIANALGLLKGAKPVTLGVHFSQPPSAAALRSAMASVADATYAYTATKSKPQPRTLKKVMLSALNAQDLREPFEHAAACCAGVELAKEWGNRPANHATPEHLAKAAKDLAQFPKIECEVLGPKEVLKLGMGAFQAVAQGSDMPLRFIVLQYHGDRKSVAPVVLVGKGITFDSGGISIKPAAEMDEMKYDMCGAASVLGTFKALALLKPKINVVGLIPACENLLSGRSVKPGDVVTSMSGQTIEILNTDAEGRLVLCDALSYAERFKPSAVIDIATLTGACVIALGAVRSGLFTKDQTLSNALFAAGEEAQDFCWPMPLDDAYADALKTNFADVANVGGRAAGSVTAAKFLERFTANYPWAHLDIAGTAWKGGSAKGATGRPVGLLLGYLVSLTG